jgi:hypothetical protein
LFASHVTNIQREGAAMTEDEWLTTVNVRRMVNSRSHSASPRKLRLYLVELFRREWRQSSTSLHEQLLDVATQFAEGEVSKKRIEQLYGEIRGVYHPMNASLLIWPDSRQMAECVDAAFQQLPYVLPTEKPKYATDEQFAKQVSQMHARASDFRDIFGNPFRPVIFSPAWRTSTSVGLAQTMYDARHFNAMPILADALQDAGCEDESILSHCRDEQQVHVRGCWVVDLVLGKK